MNHVPITSKDEVVTLCKQRTEYMGYDGFKILASDGLTCHLLQCSPNVILEGDYQMTARTNCGSGNAYINGGLDYLTGSTDECKVMCSHNVLCAGFDYILPGMPLSGGRDGGALTGACYFRSSVSNTVTNNERNCYRKLNFDFKPKINCGSGYAYINGGLDYLVGSVYGCKIMCLQNPLCAGFDYALPGMPDSGGRAGGALTGACYFRSSVNNAAPTNERDCYIRKNPFELKSQTSCGTGYAYVNGGLDYLVGSTDECFDYALPGTTHSGGRAGGPKTGACYFRSSVSAVGTFY
eukprot:Awhi_evm1s488